MPLVVYARNCKCEPNIFKKLFRSGGDAPANVPCKICGVDGKRLLSPSSSEAKVFIDNGSMARRVEVNPDIVRMNQENAARDFTEEE